MPKRLLKYIVSFLFWRILYIAIMFFSNIHKYIYRLEKWVLQSNFSLFSNLEL